MPAPRVFITRAIPPAGLDILRAEPNLRLEIWPGSLPPPPGVLRQKARGAAGLLTLLTDAVDANLLDAAGPGLKVISQMAVGVDNIDLAACA
ncbi:MAG: D-glycerate dehydrogenase, partial [Anaerolineae bacterium]